MSSETESFEQNFLFPYYRMANENREKLRLFYGDESIIGRDNNGVMKHYLVSKVCTSMLNPLSSPDLQFQADPEYFIQHSVRGISLVSVNGLLISKQGSIRRRFNHSFVLAPEQNDMFFKTEI